MLALALVLRLVRLGTWPYWHDEVHNLIKSEHLWAVVSRGEYVSNHPPLFPALVALWRALGLGANEWTMRLLPALLGVAGVAALYVLTRRIFGARAAFFGAFLLAISPFHIVHSQDLKEYIVLPLTGVLAVYFLYRAVDENARGLWAAYALSAVAACYSEYFAGPMLVALNLWALATMRGRPGRLLPWLIANVAGALLFVPQLLIFIQKAQNIMVDAPVWWVPRPTGWTVLFFLKTIAFGYSDSEPLFKIALAVYAFAGAAGAWLAWRANRRALWLLALWFALPTAMVFAISQSGNSVFLARAMLPYALPVYVLAGLALARVPGARRRTAVAALFLALAVVPLYQRYTAQYAPVDLPHRPGIHPPRDYDRAAAYILEHRQEGDLTVHAAASTWLPFYWYGFRDVPQQLVGTRRIFIDTVRGGNPRTTPNPAFDGYFPQELQAAVEGRDRVWYVFSEWERKNLPYNALDVWRWLDRHYCEIAHEQFRGVDVYLYAKTSDGAPIATEARPWDNGLETEVQYSGGVSGTYVKVEPDAGLTSMPVSERRGPLTLRFQDEPADEVLEFSDGETARTLSFAVENASDVDVSCTIVCLPSAALLEFASLYETNPAADLWHVEPRYMPAPPPEKYEMAVASARLEGPVNDALVGTLDAPAGTYATLIETMAPPGNAAANRALLSLDINGTNIAHGIPADRDGLVGWHWFRCAALETGDASVELSVEALPNPATRESWMSLGYLALLPGGMTAYDSAGVVLENRPGEVLLPAHSARAWSVALPPGAHRLDVWVYDRAPNGKAYWIWQKY